MKQSVGMMINIFFFLIAVAAATAADDYQKQRQGMVETVRADFRLTGKGADDPSAQAVLDVLGRVPRHEFVPADQRAHAYENRPLPVGHGQTISQPFIVALMTDLLRLEPADVVFELGTGSGYQAAVLAELAAEVYTMEIIPALATHARKTLERLGYDNVTVRAGDGYHGWPEKAPFDAVIVTAAGDHIPPPLIRQLKPGGRMILPVGGRFFAQQLVLVEKAADGRVTTREILPVMFVPLTGDH